MATICEGPVEEVRRMEVRNVQHCLPACLSLSLSLFGFSRTIDDRASREPRGCHVRVLVTLPRVDQASLSSGRRTSHTSD